MSTPQTNNNTKHCEAQKTLYKSDFLEILYDYDKIHINIAFVFFQISKQISEKWKWKKHLLRTAIL